MNCAVVATLFAASCAQKGERDLQKGNSLYKSEDYYSARLSYRAAIEHNPKLTEAYYKLGLTEQALQNFQAGFDALRQAVQLSPGRDEIKVSLGDLCIRGLNSDPTRPRNLQNTAAKLAEELLAKDASSFAALRIKGNLALLNDQPAAAAGYFRRAVEQRPDDPDVAIGLVKSLIKTGKDADAEQIAMQYVAKHKADAAVYDTLSGYYIGQNRKSDAERILKLKISNNPNEPSYVTELGQFYWRAERKDEALKLINSVLIKPARPTAARMAAGDFYASIGNFEEANRQFEEGVRSARNQELSFQKRLLAVSLSQGDKARAASLADKILRERPQDFDTLAIRARLRLEEGGPVALAGAIEDYKVLLRNSPRDPKIHYAHGLALQRKNDLISAKVELQEAIELDPGFVAPASALVEVLLSQHKLEDALRWADRVLSAEPENTWVRLLRGVALADSGKTNEARSEFEQVVRMAPSDASAYLQLGLLEIGEKNFQKAEAAFEKLEDLGDSQPKGSVPVYSRPGQLDQAYNSLKKDLERSPNHPLVHELLASVSIQSGQYDRAIRECQALLILNASVAHTYLRLAKVFHLKGDWNSYISNLERAQRLLPSDLALAIQLAAALESAGRQEEAEQQYRRALALRPDDPRVCNGLALAIMENKGNMDEANHLAQRAVQRQPGEPNFQDTLGWSYLKKNMTDQAIVVLGGLVKKYPDDPAFRYHLGAALLQKGDLQGARIALQSALTSKPSKRDAEEIRELLAQVHQF